MASPDISSLNFLLDRWEITEYISASVVLLAVMGEFTAEFTNLLKDESKRRRLAKASVLVLIAGLAVELVSLVRTSQLSNQIVAQLNQEAAQAKVEAGKAIERAGKADERASENEREAAQLRKDAARLDTLAEQERLARVKIEGKLAPRNLSSDQQRRIADKLRVFAGQKFEIFPHRLEDKEATNFARRLGITLQAAGWKQQNNGGRRWWMTEGVFVGAPKNATAKVADAVSSLVLALSAERILAANHNPYPNEGDSETIPIIVAKKP